MYKEDAFRALEHGNDNTSLPQYDLCFGGRRAFCRSKYADLGKKVNHIINIYRTHIVHMYQSFSSQSFLVLMAIIFSLADDMKNSGPIGRRPQTDEENTFDFLLKQAQATLRKRKV